jgi:hypothetical protein
LGQASVVDKINLYKKIREIIFLDLIQYDVNIIKLKAQMAKLQRKLMQEKTIKKSWNVKNA